MNARQGVQDKKFLLVVLTIVAIVAIYNMLSINNEQSQKLLTGQAIGSISNLKGLNTVQDVLKTNSPVDVEKLRNMIPQQNQKDKDIFIKELFQSKLTSSSTDLFKFQRMINHD